MHADDVLALGLGVTPPWKLVGQRLDTDKRPNELHIEVAADRGSRFPCPDCGRACKAHDFAEFTWRHRNFFQHHCHITAQVPRTDCPDHGVKRIQVPWAREGSRFTLVFEQAAVILAREMPVLAAARIIGMADQGKAAMDTHGRDHPGRPLAHRQVHPTCPSMHRQGSPIAARRDGPPNLRKTPRTHPSALDVNP